MCGLKYCDLHKVCLRQGDISQLRQQCEAKASAKIWAYYQILKKIPLKEFNDPNSKHEGVQFESVKVLKVKIVTVVM